jgi:hypothetical protein
MNIHILMYFIRTKCVGCLEIIRVRVVCILYLICAYASVCVLIYIYMYTYIYIYIYIYIYVYITRFILGQAIFPVQVSHSLSFAMPSVWSKSATSVTSASRSVRYGSMLCGSLPTYVREELQSRRRKQRDLLMAQFQKMIPNCYPVQDRVCLAIACCIAGRKMPPTVAEVAVWLWTSRIIPLRVQPVVTIIAMFIAL